LSDIDSPAQVAYRFVKESSGKQPSASSTVLLGFDPDGEAYILAQKPGEAIAYHGQWSYERGTMSLKFAAASLTVDAHFPLDLTDPKVTLPFQIFNSAAGTSKWTAMPLSLPSGIFAVYHAAMSDEDHPLPQQEAVNRAYAYAQARLRIDYPPKTAAAPFSWRTAGEQLVPAAMAAPSRTGAGCGDLDEPLSVAHVGPDELSLIFACGATIDIAL
jgi:hypothetical protein